MFRTFPTLQAFTRSALLLALLVALVCPGCGGKADAGPTQEEQASAVVKEFVKALSERRVDDAVGYCTADAGKVVKAGMETFPEKAIALIMSKDIGETASITAPQKLREMFDRFGVVRAAQVKSVAITAPGQATAHAVLIAPGIFHVAGIRLQEVQEEAVGDDIPPVLIHRSIQLVQEGGPEGEWKVADFDPLSMLQTTACPNYLVHRFLELASKKDFEDEFYNLFIEKAKEGPAAEFDLRQDVKDLLQAWNKKNHEVLTELMVPMMERTGKMIEEGKLSKLKEDELKAVKQRYEEGKKMLDMLIEYLPNWELQVVSNEYQVRGVAYRDRPDESMHAIVYTVARMPSFMPHRIGKWQIFEKTIREEPLEFLCVRLPNGEWRIANNPFDLKTNVTMALRRAMPSENLRDFDNN